MLLLKMFLFFMLERMKTNSSMTVYHKYYDKTNKIDKWKRQVINKVMWQGGKGASLNKGYDKANDITVYIPFENDLTGIELDIGDIIVKGTLTQEITKQSELTVENFNLTSKKINDYCSSNMKHIQIGAK